MYFFNILFTFLMHLLNTCRAGSARAGKNLLVTQCLAVSNAVRYFSWKEKYRDGAATSQVQHAAYIAGMHAHRCVAVWQRQG